MTNIVEGTGSFASDSLTYTIGSNVLGSWNGYEVDDGKYAFDPASKSNISPGTSLYIAVTQALSAWNHVDSNITFTQTPSSSANITYYFANTEDTIGDTGPNAPSPYETAGGFTEEVDAASYSQKETAFDYNIPGQPAAFQTYLAIHETGHDLGLTHPGTGTNPAYNTDMTVMSYNQPSDDAARFPATPMPFDIQAIQDKYGVGSVDSGNTTFGYTSGSTSFDTFNGTERSWTIVDTGGTNTIDLHNAPGNERIDLREAIDSNNNWVQTGSDTVQGAATIVNAASSSAEHVFIAQGSIIQDAIGGAGQDTIFGNYSANTIQGGAGNDTLMGNAGSDSVDGGSGNNLLYAYWDVKDYGSPVNPSSANLANDHDTVFGGTGSGNNTLVGSIGADSMTCAGSTGNSLLIAAANDGKVDTLIGGTGSDTLWGNLGDSLDGGPGNDTIYGNSDGNTPSVMVNNHGDGADTFYIMNATFGSNFPTVNAWGDGDSFVANIGGLDAISVQSSSAAADKLFAGTTAIVGSYTLNDANGTARLGSSLAYYGGDASKDWTLIYVPSSSELIVEHFPVKQHQAKT